jgi:hypothetical protein
MILLVQVILFLSVSWLNNLAFSYNGSSSLPLSPFPSLTLAHPASFRSNSPRRPSYHLPFRWPRRLYARQSYRPRPPIRSSTSPQRPPRLRWGHHRYALGTSSKVIQHWFGSSHVGWEGRGNRDLGRERIRRAVLGRDLLAAPGAFLICTNGNLARGDVQKAWRLLERRALLLRESLSSRRVLASPNSPASSVPLSSLLGSTSSLSPSSSPSSLPSHQRSKPSTLPLPFNSPSPPSSHQLSFPRRDLPPPPLPLSSNLNG